MATELAKAYVQIVPSARGISGSISSQLDGEASAAGNSAGNTIGTNLVSAIKKVVVAAGIGKMIKDSLFEGAALEQSVGGVETLFKDSADAVISNADKAYKTAGMSANDYMQTVTGFSATLLQGLGGDTAAAADLADKAIIDMSDNANKMGTDMTLIQNAYQGFAKQNYTMLDNLKLGYGGTQEEMIRLINDSGILDEKISSLDNVSFAQMIEAIHAVQDNLGITGTTAEEAAETFSGSFDSMRASARNLMGALTTGDSEDVEKALDALIKTCETFLVNNFLPMLKRLFGQIPGLINDVFEQLNINPDVFWTIASAIGAIVAVIGTWKTVTTAITTAQTLLNTVLAANPIMLVVAAVGGLVAAFVYLWNNCEEFREFWVGLWESIQAALYSFFEAWELGWDMIVEFFTVTIPEAWNNFQECFQIGCDMIVGFFGGLWDSICGFFGGIGDWFGDRFGEAWDNIKSAFSSVGKFFSDLWDTIKSKFTDIGTKIGDSVSGAFKAVINGALGTVESIINGFFDGINWAIDAINSIPGVDISPIGYVDLPELAEGGVLPKGKMGLLEGDGAEAVVPLEKNTGWIRRVASQLNSYQPNEAYYGSGDMSAKLDRVVTLLESYFPQLLDKCDIVVEIDGDRLAARLVPKIDSEMGRRVKNSERGLA